MQRDFFPSTLTINFELSTICIQPGHVRVLHLIATKRAAFAFSQIIARTNIYTILSTNRVGKSSLILHLFFLDPPLESQIRDN